MLKKFLALLEKYGLKIPDDKKKEFDEAVEALEKEENVSQSTKPELESKDSDSDTLKELKATRKELEDMKQIFAEMRKDREEASRAQREKLEKELADKVNTLKEKGIKEGRITEANWDSKWKIIAEKDPEQFESILADLKVDPALVKDDSKSNGEESPNTYKGPLSGANSVMVEAMSKMDNN